MLAVVSLMLHHCQLHAGLTGSSAFVFTVQTMTATPA